MTSRMTTDIDFRALVRDVRAGSLALSRQAMEAQQEGGHPDDVEALNTEAHRLQRVYEQLEGWRLHYADVLKRLAMDSDELRQIVQQLDPREETDR